MLQAKTNNKKDAEKQAGTRETWLNAAYEILTNRGIDAVKVKILAEYTGLTRTGFYWHFKDRGALLDALIEYWGEHNTDMLVAQTEAYAETITEAMLNLFDCWYDASKFDPQLDLAIRNWARNDAALQLQVDQADRQRIDAIAKMFMRFGYAEEEAETRSLSVIYTQIGYISMQVSDDAEKRMSRVPHYVVVFTGLAPSDSEFARFKARHSVKAVMPSS